ncbi:hypothetical protein [Bordetella genomosp. 13]|uniref:Uncharacterized protein n=1 Tax=Bordetella genomosp. 13 TaxID=463040 RepID=A0A1W6ZDL0_9BORD|nr:hypothetical protein [Bordetella genomosp. 13]ARP95466.1 hypothetical protein CAL15_14365 [Bordetella genomosp. 13]
MSSKVLDGFNLVAYATHPEGGVPPRAFIESRPAQGEGEPQVFEIFISRRFRSTVEAMSAARNALAAVRSVDSQGVPDHLPG